jgi:hypothetical protein
MGETSAPVRKRGKRRVPIKEGLFTQPLHPLRRVRLLGSRCHSCGETFLGKVAACENCQSRDLEEMALSRRGTLYTYTIIRHRPPGDYIGPEPFVPYAVGMVELPEGLRILAVLTGCDIEQLRIGMELELVVEKLYQDAEGNEVITYKFRPVEAEEGL